MKHSILIASTAAFMLLPVMAQGQAAPIVVLEYPAYAGASSGGLDSNNVFVADPNHTAHHRVQPNETLSHIITDYYAGSGLDLSVVQMAIVKKNKGAFVRGNPNFLFADKVIHLPSLNEMKNLVLGNHSGQPSRSSDSRQDQIYFIGG
jgi:Tfp pilus assembly protein FimV